MKLELVVSIDNRLGHGFARSHYGIDTWLTYDIEGSGMMRTNNIDRQYQQSQAPDPNRTERVRDHFRGYFTEYFFFLQMRSRLQNYGLVTDTSPKVVYTTDSTRISTRQRDQFRVYRTVENHNIRNQNCIYSHFRNKHPADRPRNPYVEVEEISRIRCVKEKEVQAYRMKNQEKHQCIEAKRGRQ
jgi:hypothetical protein